MNCILPERATIGKNFKPMHYPPGYGYYPKNMVAQLPERKFLKKDTLPTNETIFKSVKAIFPNFDMAQLPNDIEIPPFKPYVDYQNEFWRVYLQNEVLIQKMKDHLTEIKGYQEQLLALEKNAEETDSRSLNESGVKQKKKNRRTANQIVKTYQCPYEKCSKTYGSEISLNLHIKIKHQGGNKSDREKIANVLISAKITGKKIDDIADIQVKLPPNYIKNYLKFHKLKKKNKEELIKKLKKLSTIENDDKIEDQIRESLIKERQKDLEKILRKQKEHIESTESSVISNAVVPNVNTDLQLELLAPKIKSE